jgi:hypothetical protein
LKWGIIADRRGFAPAGSNPKTNGKEHYMLYTLAVVLIVLWLLGMITGYTIGSFIHVLLVIAVILILVNFISGRRRA